MGGYEERVRLYPSSFIVELYSTRAIRMCNVLAFTVRTLWR